jgi:hypothetical protein
MSGRSKGRTLGPNYGRILEVCQTESPRLSRKMIRITRSLGFVSVKPLEVLLTRDDVTLYDVLDDRNLFDECKEQNPKLIAYLSRGDNLKRLLQFVMDRFDEPEVNRSKSVERLSEWVLYLRRIVQISTYSYRGALFRY